MKRYLGLLLVMLVVLTALAGCSNQKEQTPIQVGLVAGPDSLQNDPLCRLAWDGLETMAAEEAWLSVSCVEADTYEQCRGSLRIFAKEGRKLVIAVGVPVETVTQVAGEYPQIHFAVFSEEEPQASNVVCIAFARNEEGYLAGLAAGLTTDSNTVGYVQGGRQGRLEEYAAGYLAGVMQANAKARIVQIRVRSLTDIGAGQSAGVDLIANGADVIYHAAGQSGEGVIAACKLHGVWAIGANVDQSSLAPDRVLTSTLQRADEAVRTLVREAAQGEFSSGLRRFGLAEGCVSLAPGRMTEEVTNGVEAVVKRVKSGAITVPDTIEELEAAYPGLYTLGTSE